MISNLRNFEITWLACKKKIQGFANKIPKINKYLNDNSGHDRRQY